MSEERTRRVGENQALYRQLNERIEDLNEAFGAITGKFAVVCECGNLECVEQIQVSTDVYERARASPNRFILKPGHEVQDLEEVVDTEHEYVVIEKRVAVARRLAEDTDPRADQA